MSARPPAPPRARPCRAPALLLGLLALLGLLMLPTAAHAHLRLERASPGEGDTLRIAPEALRLHFSQAVQLPFSRVTLLGPDGAVALAEPVLEPGSEQTLRAAVEGPLRAGEYTVRWQTAGADGHPIRGEFAFRIAQGAAGLAPAGPPEPGPPAAATGAEPAGEDAPPAVAGPGGFDVRSPAYVAVRWLVFLGLLGTIGAAAFALLVLRPLRRARAAEPAAWMRHAGRRAAGIGLLAALALLVAAGLRLLAQAAALGIGVTGPDGLLGSALARTTWGWGWTLQVAGALAALGAFAAARRGVRAGWPAAAAAAAVLAFTPALAGHAVSVEPPALAVLSDGLHVLGAGGWLGSLLLVLAAGLPATRRLGAERRGAEELALVRGFSRAALACAALVVATGLFASWLHLDAPAALWSTAYGRTLLLKLAALLVVFAAGAYNWRRVTPALGTAEASARLRRSAALELTAGAVVLAVTAVLVATPP